MGKKILTQARAEALTQALTTGGHDFTLEELVEYSETLKNAVSEKALANVSGGAGNSNMGEDFIISGSAVLIGGAAAAVAWATRR